jgi:hypothetical protein
MKIKLFVVTAALLCSMGAEAKLAGKNVIMVHGFISEHLNTRPSSAEQASQASNYWKDYWASRSEGYLTYPSHERVQGRIKDSMKTQFQELQRNRKCESGCVFVTHSTGDLVLRDALTRFGQWGIDRNKVKVLSVIDLAGAGGGTELADLAVSTASTRGPVTGIVRAIAGAVLSVNFKPESLGVLNDLRVGTARSIARQNNVYPRLRVAGAGDQFLRITKGIIRGYDDSVVGMHSSCGSKYVGTVESCSSSVRSNGQLASARGPGTLLHNHFPIVMGNSADHEELRNNKKSGGALTTVVNNRTIGGLNIDFATNTKRRSWSWFRKVREINGSSNKSVSANVYDTLNR